MAWKETNVYEERMKFVVTWKQGGWSMTDLCREFGITRPTGYKYLKQYEEEGIDGLKDKSTAPKKQAKEIDESIVKLILFARDKYPLWGPRKILAWLKAKYPSIKNWPHKSSAGRILERNGRIVKRKRIKKSIPVFPFSHVIEANDVWCIDYKGHFTVGDGMRCDPLTITDAYSRFLLGCDIVKKVDTKNAKRVMKRIFMEYGLPEAIRSDNGTPFVASRSLAGLSQLSVWWLKLGINLERIEPGKPQQNGRHERMHRTLKQSTALPPRSSLKEQQDAFDRFKQEYNIERPHEALKDQTPSEYYKRSIKEFPKKVPEVFYPTNMEVHIVNDLGNIGCGLHRIFLSSTLIGEPVGLEEISDRHTRIHFCNVILGVIDTYTGKVLRYKNPLSIEYKEI